MLSQFFSHSEVTVDNLKFIFNSKKPVSCKWMMWKSTCWKEFRWHWMEIRRNTLLSRIFLYIQQWIYCMNNYPHYFWTSHIFLPPLKFFVIFQLPIAVLKFSEFLKAVSILKMLEHLIPTDYTEPCIFWKPNLIFQEIILAQYLPYKVKIYERKVCLFLVSAKFLYEF